MSFTTFDEHLVVRPGRNFKADERAARQPRFHVVLWDDNDHTYVYVTKMLRQLFGHSSEMARELTIQVDKQGSAICLTTTKEHAELKRDQIHGYGKDEMISKCCGSMSSTIEPEC